MDKHIHLPMSIRKICLIVLSSVILLTMIKCDDMNSIHEKYYDWGEDIYTGVVDSLKAFSGYEKIRFTWELNADPRITKTVIYWNQRADSIVVDVKRTQSGRLQLAYDLADIEEDSYVFEFITRDNEGHFSLPVEVPVDVYGPLSQQTLRNRGIVSITKQTDGSMLITWEDIAYPTIQYVTVYYEIDGDELSTQVENSESQTILNGLNTGDIIKVVTTYFPENALETLDSPAREYTLPKLEREINKANFSMVVLAGDNTSVNNNRPLSKIWDGSATNPNILHTVENAAGFNFPHHFTFDMGVLAEISRFRIWARADVTAFTGHSPRYFEIWGTNELQKAVGDNTYWVTDDWKADWVLMGDHEIIKPTANESAVWAAGWEYDVSESAGKVRYIRLVINSPNWQGSNCVNIGEITLWGDY